MLQLLLVDMSCRGIGLSYQGRDKKLCFMSAAFVRGHMTGLFIPR